MQFTCSGNAVVKYPVSSGLWCVYALFLLFFLPLFYSFYCFLLFYLRTMDVFCLK